jgi:non-ribosomal peptide synthetase component F
VKEDMQMEGNVSIKERMIASGQSIIEREYWINELSGDFEKCGFWRDYKITAKKESGMGVVGTKFNHALVSNLIRLSKGSDTKLFMILAAGLVGLLHRYTGSKDIIVGAPIYRQKVEGNFINTIIPLRSRLNDNMTFRELLLQVRQKIIHGYKNQNYPMDTLLYELEVPVSGDDYPLFDIAVLLENVHDKRYIQHTDPGMYFSFSSGGDGIEVSLEYHCAFYSRPTAERIISHYAYFLEGALAHVNLPVRQIDIMPGEEREQLLYTFSCPGEEDSAGVTARIRDKTIQELFEEQVEKVPANIAAAVYGAGSTSPEHPEIRKHQVTYRELNETSNRLAWLLKEKGVRPDTIVGLMLEPSIHVIVGILGILKAGGAYLPIDINTPPERVYTLLQGSNTAFLITEGKRQWPGKINVDIEIIDLLDETVYGTRGKAPDLSNPPKINTSIDLAYVIYTSGSTGTPKGVLIEHRSILNYVFWRLKGYNQTWEDVSMQLLSISFDGFCANLYPGILNGGKVILLSEDKLKEIDYILGVIKEEKITTFSLTPLLYKAIVETAEAEDLQSVKFVVIGGERANKHLLEMSNKAAPHLTH